jgi:hypothetical protein
MLLPRGVSVTAAVPRAKEPPPLFAENIEIEGGLGKNHCRLAWSARASPPGATQGPQEDVAAFARRGGLSATRFGPGAKA